MNNLFTKLGPMIILIIILLMSTTLISFALPVEAGSDVKLQVDGKIVNTDVAPAIVNDRTLVPARAIFEAAGGKVTWVPESPSDITVEYSGKIVKLKIGSKVATVDGAEKTMDVPAQLFPGDRTLIPVRFVAESLGFDVDWNNDSRTVIIASPNNDGQVTPPTTPAVTEPGITDPKPQASNISKVSFAASGNGHRVTITANNAMADYTQASVGSPNRFYVDIKNSKLTATPAEFLTGNVNSVVKQVRSSQLDDTTVRVVMDLRQVGTPNITMSADKKQMYLDFAKIKFEPMADGKLVVMLDPGHGESTGGKRSFDGSLREYEFNRSVANKIAAILRAQGIEVLMTVSDNQDTSLNDRCVIANNSNADIFVSIHANAFGTNWNTVNGWEAYIYKAGGFSEVLAKEIEKTSNPSLGLTNRGVKTSEFYVVKYTDMPSVLIEHGFYTNATEVEKLKSDSFRQKCAEADAQGIINFLNKYK